VARIRGGFDRAAATYDAGRRQLVPDLDGFYGAVPALLPYAPHEEIEILDLGAGTGLLAAVVAAAFPAARFTLVDVAGQMLELARSRFEEHGDRVRHVVADYAAWPLPRDLHAVISGLSIHHLEHDAKRDLFARIRESLRPGGVFVNAEQVHGGSDDAERANAAWWLEYARGAGADEHTIAAAIERMREDKTVPLAEQLDWLRAAGFHDVRAVYENRRFAVYCGRR
jgi:tRNA (cmo5U34)-methyltransferase